MRLTSALSVMTVFLHRLPASLVRCFSGTARWWNETCASFFNGSFNLIKLSYVQVMSKRISLVSIAVEFSLWQALQPYQSGFDGIRQFPCLL